MKNFLFLISYLSAIIMVVSCKPSVITTHYDNGQLKEKYEYRGDSLKNGSYELYSEGGIIQEESNYQDGKLHGVRKIYSIHGKLEVSESYVNDVFHGPYLTYHENGNIKLEASYDNNVMAGIVKGYYPSGKLKEEVTFADNMENGPFKEYHENGQLKWEGSYKNGNNEFGQLKEYNESGTLIRKMMCDDRAICTTTWTIDGSHLLTNNNNDKK